MLNRFFTFTAFALILTSCGENAPKTDSGKTGPEKKKEDLTATIDDKELEPNKPTDFLPSGFRVLEELKGDLNKDGQEDCVLFVKATDKKNLMEDEDLGKVDKNRRGLIVLLNNKGHYEPITENLACFSSEYESGGIYYAPDLGLEIKKNTLIISYEHGRYGYWSYKFKVSDNQVQLIGYDASDNFGPLVREEKSINFLTRKKLVRTNQNEDPDGEDDFTEEWSKFDLQKPITLAGIKDFDELDMSKY